MLVWDRGRSGGRFSFVSALARVRDVSMKWVVRMKQLLMLSVWRICRVGGVLCQTCHTDNSVLYCVVVSCGVVCVVVSCFVTCSVVQCCVVVRGFWTHAVRSMYIQL